MDLQLCIRNRDTGYHPGTNPLTDESNEMRLAFEQPFKEYVRLAVPDMEFSGYNYLEAFKEIALIDNLGRLETLKQKIDAAEQAGWDPLA